MEILRLNNLKVSIGSKVILDELNLDIQKGKIHYLMGKNGTGKSTIGKVIMGHPDYKVISGDIIYKGKSIKEKATNERSIDGIYLANQYPVEVPGVNLYNFLRIAYNSRFPKEKQLSVFRFKKYIEPILEQLNIPREFLDRNLNEGFSGGEKKKCEILQMALLKPDLVILDETDSGLDVDSLKEVFLGIKKIKELNKNMSILLITHYNRITEFLKPDIVHILSSGKIIETGGPKIVDRIDKKGYI